MFDRPETSRIRIRNRVQTMTLMVLVPVILIDLTFLTATIDKVYYVTVSHSESISCSGRYKGTTDLQSIAENLGEMLLGSVESLRESLFSQRYVFCGFKRRSLYNGVGIGFEDDTAVSGVRCSLEHLPIIDLLVQCNENKVDIVQNVLLFNVVPSYEHALRMLGLPQ